MRTRNDHYSLLDIALKDVLKSPTFELDTGLSVAIACKLELKLGTKVRMVGHLGIDWINTSHTCIDMLSPVPSRNIKHLIIKANPKT